MLLIGPIEFSTDQMACKVCWIQCAKESLETVQIAGRTTKAVLGASEFREQMSIEED